MPGRGDPSQIPFLAHDRQLIQGPLEPNAAFVARLQNAFPAWRRAGAAPAVIGQLQAYLQGFQAGTGYEFAIVSDPRTLDDASQVTAWWTLRLDDAIGAEPLLSVVPKNFDWDGASSTWRCWLVLYQYPVQVLSGTGAGIGAIAFGGSFLDPGHNVGGVWVPRTFGAAVNEPFLSVSGLSGLTQAHVGGLLSLLGGHPENTGSWQIVQVTGPTTCTIANPGGVPGDAGLVWTVSTYPWIAPALAWGSPGQVWGQGESAPPPIDTGANVGGVWQPTQISSAGTAPSFSWGLRVDSLEIQTIRQILRAWKSAGTYYPNIIVCYDGDEGAYDRLSGEGSGNPDGTFGEVGALDAVSGVWVYTRATGSRFDCYCQGTGRAVACSVENFT